MIVSAAKVSVIFATVSFAKNIFATKFHIAMKLRKMNEARATENSSAAAERLGEQNMKYFIVDAFTDRPFGGNPAGVVLLDSDAFPEEKLMLNIAAELRYSETAFVLQHSDNELNVRYFTPKAEVELCGHR